MMIVLAYCIRGGCGSPPDRGKIYTIACWNGRTHLLHLQRDPLVCHLSEEVRFEYNDSRKNRMPELYPDVHTLDV
jgi:hypothetical protein